MLRDNQFRVVRYGPRPDDWRLELTKPLATSCPTTDTTRPQRGLGATRKLAKDSLLTAVETPRVDTGMVFDGLRTIVCNAEAAVAGTEKMLEQINSSGFSASHVLHAEAVQAIEHGKRWLDHLRRLQESAHATTADGADFIERSRATTARGIAAIRAGAAALWGGGRTTDSTATPPPRSASEAAVRINEENRKLWADRKL